MISPSRIAALIVAVTTVVAIAMSNLTIYLTDMLLPGFTARFDNYAFSTVIPLAVSPLLIVPLAWAISRLMELKAALERSVRTDALTGLLNRHGFFEHAERVFQRADKDARPVALMMVDVDRFKEVNDTFGHAAGDDLLKQIARGIAEAVAGAPVQSIAARFGGDEFAVLLTDLDASAAGAVAARLCLAVRGATGSHHEAAPCPTVSVGLAMRAGGRSVDAVMKAADEAAYAAKRAGRDRWILAAPADPVAPHAPVRLPASRAPRNQGVMTSDLSVA